MPQKRNLPSKSPIDKRAEMSPAEAAFCAIRENMLRQQKREGKPPKEPPEYKGWLQRHRGPGVTSGEQKAINAKTKYEQRGSTFPQVAENQNYQKPKRKL